jgi:hypothetical protein
VDRQVEKETRARKNIDLRRAGAPALFLEDIMRISLKLPFGYFFEALVGDRQSIFSEMRADYDEGFQEGVREGYHAHPDHPPETEKVDENFRLSSD